MATKSNQLIEVRRGESMALLFPVKDQDNLPVSVATHAIKFAIAKWRGADSNLLTLTKADNPGQFEISNVNGTNDGITVTLLTDDTEHSADTYHWDLRLTLDAVEKVVAEGSFRILESPTN